MSLARRVDKLCSRFASLAARRLPWEGVIVVAGDSLCGGRAPAFLEALLCYAGVRLRVRPVWRGGIGFNEVSGLVSTAQRGHDPTPVRGVIVLAGTNEVKRDRHPRAASLVEALTLVVRRVRSAWPDAGLVLCTVPLPGAHPRLRDDAAPLVRDLVNPSIRAVASSERVTLCDLEHLFEGIDDARTDGVHPTARGDELLATAWWEVLGPLLRGTRHPTP